MASIISTKQICDMLQVSRNWVNMFLRPMGGAVPERRDHANIRTIFYYQEDILGWFNRNARYSRQTQQLDLTRYADPADIDAVFDEMDSIPETTPESRNVRHGIYQDFLRKHLPEGMTERAELIDSRNRGQLPWVPVIHHIDRLEQLRTMRQLMDAWGHRSQEMTYRSIYERGMIRVEVMGRTWFMDAPDANLEYPLLMPMMGE